MPKKIERCVRRVKKKSPVVNPYAVCRASVMKTTARELTIGTRIEKKEHGFNMKISRKIAMDHIKEHPRYYTDKKYGIVVIEKKMKGLNI